MTVYIWFARGRGTSAAISRWVLLSPWDRVALSLDNVYIYESTPAVGVTIRTIERFNQTADVRMKYQIDISNPERLRTFIKSSLLCGFNWWRFFGFKGFNGYNRMNYTSSEFVSKAVEVSGTTIKPLTSRQTPLLFWLSLVSARVSRIFPEVLKI